MPQMSVLGGIRPKQNLGFAWDVCRSQDIFLALVHSALGVARAARARPVQVCQPLHLLPLPPSRVLASQVHPAAHQQQSFKYDCFPAWWWRLHMMHTSRQRTALHAMQGSLPVPSPGMHQSALRRCTLTKSYTDLCLFVCLVPLCLHNRQCEDECKCKE